MPKRDEFALANQRANRKRDRIPAAVSAHYDRKRNRIVIGLNTKMDVAFPPTLVQGLENAPRAFLGLFRGDNFGKLLVRVSSDPTKSGAP